MRLFALTFSVLFACCVAVVLYNLAVDSLLELVYDYYGRDAWLEVRFWSRVTSWCLIGSCMIHLLCMLIKLDNGLNVPFVDFLARLFGIKQTENKG